jgi:hypothetical protein
MLIVNGRNIRRPRFSKCPPRSSGRCSRGLSGEFFRAKDRNGNPIDYAVATSGNLQFVPTDPGTLKALAVDYKRMAEDGILLDDDQDFETLLERCRDLEKRANAYKG